MEKKVETMLETSSDKESLKWISVYLNNYPTKDGYRVESFISPRFVRITVYKVN